MKKLALLACITVAALFGAAIDGKWTAEVKAGGKKAAATTTTLSLELKSSGNQLTGNVMVSGRKRSTPLAIQKGKIEGDRFSFTTVQKGKKADQTINWSGTVSADTLTGTRTREGGKRGQPFTAKKG